MHISVRRGWYLQAQYFSSQTNENVMCLTTAAPQTDGSQWSGEYCKCVLHTDLFSTQEFCGSNTAMEGHKTSKITSNVWQYVYAYTCLCLCLGFWGFLSIKMYWVLARFPPNATRELCWEKKNDKMNKTPLSCLLHSQIYFTCAFWVTTDDGLRLYQLHGMARSNLEGVSAHVFTWRLIGCINLQSGLGRNQPQLRVFIPFCEWPVVGLSPTNTFISATPANNEVSKCTLCCRQVNWVQITNTWIFAIRYYFGHIVVLLFILIHIWTLKKTPQNVTFQNLAQISKFVTLSIYLAS